MSSLYSIQDVATYLRKRRAEVVRLIEQDGLPAVNLPGERRLGRKITLHGLHRWMSARAVGGEFITVQELAAEMAACVEAPATSPVHREAA